MHFEMAAVAPTEVSASEVPTEFSSTGDDHMKDSNSQASKMDKNGKKDKEKEKEDGRVQFCKKDWTLLLDWLEADGNFEAVKGTDKTTRVGTKYPTKRQAFDDLGKYINANQFKGSTLVKFNWEAARNRYNYLGMLYKKAKEAMNATGWGLTKKDEAKGILTLDAKIEKICPCFERVHALLGGTPRTDLKGNTLATSLGGRKDEHLPWEELKSDVIADSDAEGESEADVEIIDNRGTWVNVDDLATEGRGPQMSAPTPIGAMQSPLPVPHSPALSPATEDLDEEYSLDPSLVSGPTVTAKKAIPMKSKATKHSAYPNKKRHGSDKGKTLTGAFSSGMDNIGAEKAKSNDIKSRAYELRFQSLAEDRALRSDTAQRRLALEEEMSKRKLAIEEERLAIEKQKVQNELHTSRVEATIRIVNENQKRTPEELTAILKAFADILPPLT